MKRRSRAGGERTKGRRSTTPKPTRRDAPKVEIRSKPPPVAEEEVARLARERDEALEQQTATSGERLTASAKAGGVLCDARISASPSQR
jgi:hypothetical protein